ncbi:Di-and tricarboxylate transporter [Loktanella fryxellensis]|uniref:Di-and tricarboxylate transporter n=1 Tax=Loktanella fryxellensis TaxID=245187 RepID=A0A1H8C4R2_9RHOB|nr:SLC13 family permease [Loktanella fryxellensis]SEM89839.1 Di-and tricarboxylate transporter [Loktanella fryxellensis]
MALMVSRPGTAQFVVGAAGLALVAVLLGTDALLPRVAAVSALSVALFATRLLPEVVTAIGTFLAFIAIGAAPTDVIFSGFASSGFWLLFAGLVIGTAITATGLGMQLALRIFQRTGASYRRAAVLLALCGLALGILVPSTLPRVIVLMPIALSLAQTMGYAPGSRGHVGLCATAAAATLLPTYAFLTANLPVIIQFGAAETLYGIAPSYGAYFVEQAPINLLRLVVLLAVMLPFAPPRAEAASQVDAPAPLTPPQRRLLVLLAMAIGLWMTDGLHGISPAWVGLALAAVLLVPAFGMLDAAAMKTKVDLSPAFFIAALFAMTAVAQASGLGTAVADALVPLMGLGGGGLRDFYAVTGLSVVLSHLTTAPAAPAVLVPMAEAFATRTGWPVETVVMAQVIGLATPILPYQAPPLIVAMALAAIPVGALLRVCLWLALAVAVIGLPLTWVWWSWLGMFG